MRGAVRGCRPCARLRTGCPPPRARPPADRMHRLRRPRRPRGRPRGPDRGRIRRSPRGIPRTSRPTWRSPRAARAGSPAPAQIDGTPYDIRLPEKWNGSLLIYSHGLRAVDPVAADGPAFEPIAEAAPGLASGVDVGRRRAAGAGVRPGRGGLADRRVGDRRRDRLDHHRPGGVRHQRRRAQPHLHLGPVARRPGGPALRAANDWVSGSASMCGLLAGLNPNMDLALDAAVGVKALLEPDLTADRVHVGEAGAHGVRPGDEGRDRGCRGPDRARA